ncbi:23281_t:CDS:2 [Gigaspora margarita]|uniref:23281_t:CDS:1 n=1 Tax=Gigaspora margarita TaxID=4874 RepID=A0ABN7UVV4_GIGMA|nr:23281_t:CDS:2 [Gigaspora margarita]
MRYSKALPVSNLANCPDGETHAPESFDEYRCIALLPFREHPSPCEEDRKTDEFLDSVQKKSVSDGIRLRKREEKLQKRDLTSDDKRSLQKKNQREKFIQEVSSDLIQSDTNLAKQQLVTLSLTSSPCKQADSSSFAHLYEKLRGAEDFVDRAVQEAIICYCQFGKALIQRRGEIASERQVDPESNAVSRVLNMEVRAQLPADTSDALLWKRIEQAKKL